MTTDLHIVTVEQQDPRLGRHVVHDPASRNYAYRALAVPDKPKKPRRHKIYGPRTTPRQKIGCCTGVDQCVKRDAAGNRIKGVVLNMADAEHAYSIATGLDGDGQQYPPTDTGSSALYACKAAQQLAWIERYEWIFNGAAGVLAALVGTPGKPGRCVGVGTWWYQNMFDPDPKTLLVTVAGPKVGGHQWTITGWEPRFDAFEGLCWWGPDFGANGRFRIRYADLDALLADDGDAHVTYRRSTL
jgi:hypothetical protein